MLLFEKEYFRDLFGYFWADGMRPELNFTLNVAKPELCITDNTFYMRYEHLECFFALMIQQIYLILT